MTNLAITATAWLIGQTSGTMGIPGWLGAVANLSAVSLMSVMFYIVVIKHRAEERKAARDERIQARKHMERVVEMLTKDTCDPN